MAFEQLMQRVDTVAIARLSNASMTFGAASGRVLFDRPSAEPFDGALSVEDFEVRCDLDEFTDIVRGSTVYIDGAEYVVRDEPLASPDAGILTLRVRSV